MKTMAAAKCKTNFLSVLKDVELKRESVTVSRNGRPVARIVPLDIPEEQDPLDAFLFPGGVEIVGDIMAPIFTDDEWEGFFEESAKQMR